MTRQDYSVEDVRAFWNSRAGLNQWAGTRDVLAKELEIRAIASYVRDDLHILDVGCGNGITGIELARRFHVDVLGVDFAPEMVAAASDLAAGTTLKGTVHFQVGDVTKLTGIGATFDLIYTERTLINLPDWEAQAGAIGVICGLLSQGGQFVMCENSHDGLDNLNALRERVGLPKIIPPWHNRYLRGAEVGALHIPGVELVDCVDYSSTYYFLSRVVNAWLAAQQAREPDYEAPVNQLARELPPLGNCGQGRIWLWRKMA